MSRRLAAALAAKGHTEWRLLITYGGPNGHEEVRELHPKRGKHWTYIGATRKGGQEWRSPPPGMWVVRIEYRAVIE